MKNQSASPIRHLGASVRSSTGVDGVCPIFSKWTGEVLGWRAFWSERVGSGSKQRTRDFYESVHSDAFERAKKLRKRMEKDNA